MVFVYLICLQLGIPLSFALLAAAVFATHPIHSEAVDWIAASPDLACGALYFCGLWAFLKGEASGRRSWWLVSAAVFFLALLSKEMAITLPALLLLLTFRPGSEWTWTRRAQLLDHGASLVGTDP